MKLFGLPIRHKKKHIRPKNWQLYWLKVHRNLLIEKDTRELRLYWGLHKWHRKLLAIAFLNGFIAFENSGYKNRNRFYRAIGFLKMWGLFHSKNSELFQKKKYYLTKFGKQIIKKCKEYGIIK